MLVLVYNFALFFSHTIFEFVTSALLEEEMFLSPIFSERVCKEMVLFLQIFSRIHHLMSTGPKLSLWEKLEFQFFYLFKSIHIFHFS